MSLFTNKETIKSPILNKYLTMSRRFQNIGILVVLFSILFNTITQNRLLIPILIFFIPGALLLIYGGSCLQSHNLIKAFAQQTSVDPTREMAEAFLETMTRVNKTSLTKTSINLVQSAIETYRNDADSDPELTAKLQEALTNHISKKFF